MLIELGLPETPPITKEGPTGKRAGPTRAPLTYFMGGILIVFLAVLTMWRLSRTTLPAS